MKYRLLDLDFEYEFLEKFWKKSKMGVAPPLDMLPRTGISLYNEDARLVGAIFLFYIIESQIVLIGYPILDPEFKEGRDEALDSLYAMAENEAFKNGYRLAQTFSNLDFISSRLEKNGWKLGDPKMDNYLKLL